MVVFAAKCSITSSPHAPLTLADLACLDISASPEEPPAAVHTRFRFELGGPLGGGRPSSTRRWQATGLWEIDWIRSGASWRIATWRPLEMVSVEGPEVVFSDITEAAFGKDPSYRSHLLRDTNYWRTVLDKASGIEIFGNNGVSVGDVDGDGQDEIYLYASRKDCPTGSTASGRRASSRTLRARWVSICSTTPPWLSSPTSSTAAART